MGIQTVKDLGDRYLVELADGCTSCIYKNNPKSQEVQDWLDEGNDLSPLYDLNQLKEEKKQVCRSYLQSTDWYCLRYADRGIEYPDSVKDKREAARNITDQIDAMTDITEVEAFDVQAVLDAS
jgi:hypothetical protein